MTPSDPETPIGEASRHCLCSSPHRSFLVSGNSLITTRACVCQLVPRGFTLRWSLKPPDSLRSSLLIISQTESSRRHVHTHTRTPPQLFCSLQPTSCTLQSLRPPPTSKFMFPRLACLAQLRSISVPIPLVVEPVPDVHLPTHTQHREAPFLDSWGNPDSPDHPSDVTASDTL